MHPFRQRESLLVTSTASLSSLTVGLQMILEDEKDAANEYNIANHHYDRAVEAEVPSPAT